VDDGELKALITRLAIVTSTVGELAAPGDRFVRGGPHFVQRCLVELLRHGGACLLHCVARARRPVRRLDRGGIPARSFLVREH
jgi:hypothetical protein